jgi:Tat protein translocase TatB subunit
VGNLGGGELLVILILGLLVLGPARLGVVTRQTGRIVAQVRRLAGGFQEELRDLVEDPSIEALARERGRRVSGPATHSPDGPLDGPSEGPSEGPVESPVDEAIDDGDTPAGG